MISKALHGPRNREHCCGNLDIAKDGILSGNDQIAGERKLKTAAYSEALNRRHCRQAQRFDGALGLIHIGNECAKPIGILAGPFTHVAPETEVWPLRPDHQYPDAAFARAMHGIAETYGIGRVDPVKGGIG